MKKNLVLTGMMGVGKSTIGKKLAKKLKIKFIDLDKIIEKRRVTRLKIYLKLKEKIISGKLRKSCTQELKKVNAVIALGGGAFLLKYKKRIRRL